MSLRVVPCSITEARVFVTQVHRHHSAPLGGLFAAAVADDETIVGVAIASRPVARMLDDGWTYEVTRVATNGTRNACSMLYGAIRQAARALGYLRGITYTLPSEGGASLRAAGWRCDGEAGGGEWSRLSRPCNKAANPERKTRWSVTDPAYTKGTLRPRVTMPTDDRLAQCTLWRES